MFAFMLCYKEGNIGYRVWGRKRMKERRRSEEREVAGCVGNAFSSFPNAERGQVCLSPGNIFANLCRKIWRKLFLFLFTLFSTFVESSWNWFYWKANNSQTSGPIVLAPIGWNFFKLRLRALKSFFSEWLVEWDMQVSWQDLFLLTDSVMQIDLVPISCLFSHK